MVNSEQNTLASFPYLVLVQQALVLVLMFGQNTGYTGSNHDNIKYLFIMILLVQFFPKS